VFRFILPVLKIYSSHYVYYRFLILAGLLEHHSVNNHSDNRNNHVIYIVYLNIYEIFLYVTDAPKEILEELRICTIHFPEDMIYKDTPRRVLKNDVPTKYLVHAEAINQSNIASTSKNNDFISCENATNSELIYEENVQCNSNFTPVFQSVHKKEAIITYR